MQLRLWHVLIATLLGAGLALVVTWKSPWSVTSIEGQTPSPGVVESLRTIPSEAVLAEVWELAVGVPKFDQLEAREAVRVAESVIRGEFEWQGTVRKVAVPFRPRSSLYQTGTWNLRVSSFLLPSLLIRAYAASGETRFLSSAVDYVLDWADFEDSLLVPRGLVFNDHAISARAVVVTELWRFYRSSEMYSGKTAASLLKYVDKLSRLLRAAELYEYRSNHGAMQNLALLHLAVAFPNLDMAAESLKIGRARFYLQLEHYVNLEGVVLEHSAEYQEHGVRAMTAAWRYLGLLGEPVTAHARERYQGALDYLGFLFRPDGSLPPIGDTGDYSVSSYSAVDLDVSGKASRPITQVDLGDPPPAEIFVAPAAGYAVVWRGLENWPKMAGLSQTVVHWANFPSQVHKHADELGISLWAEGVQWLRGIGYWPYGSGRGQATGWRSSNAPHWLEEESSGDRQSSLAGYATEPDIAFFDLSRSGQGGGNIRRQLAIIQNRLWIVIDSFSQPEGRKAEIIWRFSPGTRVGSVDTGTFNALATVEQAQMLVSIATSESWASELDSEGLKPWNSGVVVEGQIVSSPAIRLVGQGHEPVVATAFALCAGSIRDLRDGELTLEWTGEGQWTASFNADPSCSGDLVRNGESLQWRVDRALPIKVTVADIPTEQVETLRESASQALRDAEDTYGAPFHPMIERRQKVSVVIVILAVIQLIVLVFARGYFPKHQPWLLAAASFCWVALAIFLGNTFLV